MTRLALLRKYVLFALPAILFLVIYYWRGLTVWFQADDYAWLSQWRDAGSPMGLLKSLFIPRAQGSIRPLSERAYFLALSSLFGWNPLPFRLIAFATQAANFVLLASLAHRITNSRLASVVAPLFWACSSAIAVPMMWSSAYNQILCACFLLGALRAWIAYCDTGRRKWLWLQYGLFLLGFGALESIVVYPVMALGWKPGWSRWRAWAPMFAVSAAYTLLHQSVAPAPAAGPYALHVDASMFTTLGRYLHQLTGGPLVAVLPVAEWLRFLGAASPWIAGAVVVAFGAWRRNWAYLVPLALILAPLLPMLPLRDHVTHYYLVTPAAGLALLLAWALREVARWRPGALAAIVIAAAIVTPSLVAARANRDFWHERGQGIRTLVLGLAHARSIHPDAKIVVTGIDGQRFYASFAQGMLRALDVNDVYIDADSARNMDRLEPEPDPNSFVLEESALRQALIEDRAVLYASAGTRLRNITSLYRATHGITPLRDRLPTEVWSARIEPALPMFAAHLGPGWQQAGGNARWISKQTTVYVVLEQGTRPSKLVIEGYCPEVQFSKGPFQIRVALSKPRNVPLGAFTVAAAGEFRVELPWPASIPPGLHFLTLNSSHTVAFAGSKGASVLVSLIEVR